MYNSYHGLTIAGPFWWYACLCQNGETIEDRQLYHNLKYHRKYINIKFDNLTHGKTYKVCVKILHTTWLRYFSSRNECLSTCSDDQKLLQSQCKMVLTECKPLPEPSGIPSQISSSFEEDLFNPFTEIKFEMSEGTFDGELSGLNRFRIRYHQTTIYHYL